MEIKKSLEKIQDPKFYLENFCKVKTKSGGLAPFILKEAQKDIFNTMRWKNRVMILKARQIGFSTAVTGFLYHYAITHPGSTVAIVGYNSTMTSELLDKVKTFWRTTPEILRPTIAYNSKFEISFPTIESKILVLPSTENVGRGYTISACLHGKTKIAMKDNTYKNILDIKKGDEIINGNGGYSQVFGLDKKVSDKRMLNISSYGSKDLLLTEDHKILTREKITGKDVWKEAGDVVVGDYLAYPYFQNRNRTKEIHIPDTINDKYKTRATKINRNIKISKEFGEFVGWYIAEGHCHENRISLSIHSDEIGNIMRVIECIKPHITSINIYESKTSKGAVVYLYGKDFAKFIGSLFGDSAKNKYINQSVWNWGWNFGYGLLRGLIDGDGCTKNDREIRITTISERLAISIKRLIVSLRLGLPGIYKTENIYRYGIKTSDRYDIIISGKGNYKIRRKLNYKLPTYNSKRAKWKFENKPNANLGYGYWLRGKKYYWSKISSIKEIEKEEFVYDIILENEPHSFLTHAGVVHNCLLTELAFWEKPEEKMAAIENSVPIDGKIIIESTPNGIGSLYHRMWMAEDNGYEKKDYGWWWEYCIDEDTEVLTVDGWKKIDEFNVGDKHFTLNLKTKEIEIKEATDKTVHNFDDKMVHFKSQNIDMMVTPNHRCVVQSSYNNLKSGDEWKLKKAEDVKTSDIIPISSNGWKENKKKKYSDELVELIGWIVTEGNFDRYFFRIYQNFGRDFDRIEALCKKLKYKYSRSIKNVGSKKTGEIRIWAESSQEIIGILGKKTKILPINFILNLTFEQLEILKRTMIMGDGSIDSGTKDFNLCGDKCTFVQKDKGVAEGFQILSLLTGNASTLSQNKSDDKCFRVRVKKSRFARQYSKKYIKYTGRVWCPTNDNETIIIRRNGKVMITGQTRDQIEAIRKRMNNPMKFAQEYELEFLSSGRSVFDQNVIKKQRENILKVGDERKLKNGEKFVVYKRDEWTFYSPPEKDGMYVVGVDTSEGVEGGDYAVAVIFDKTSGEEVAIFRGLVAPDRLAEKINKVGREYNDALMVVEINNHGLTTVTTLKQLLYPSLYFRPAKFENIGSTITDKIGWQTNKKTKPILIDEYAQAVRENELIIHSKEILDEMLVYVYDKNNNMTAQSGFHDDAIMAAAISYQGFKMLYSGSLKQLDYNIHLPTSFAY